MALSTSSELIAFKPSPSGYEELAKYKIAESPTWAIPIFAGNRVIDKDRHAVALWTLE